MTCKGKAHVEWEEDNVVDDDKSIHYDELYMEDVQYLIGSGKDKIITVIVTSYGGFGMIYCFVFYAVSAIFQPCNGGWGMN